MHTEEKSENYFFMIPEIGLMFDVWVNALPKFTGKMTNEVKQKNYAKQISQRKGGRWRRENRRNDHLVIMSAIKVAKRKRVKIGIDVGLHRMQ